MNKITLALVIVKPGHLRNGLQSLLRTIPQIEILAESNDPSILRKMNEDFHPELILLDGGLIAEDDWSALTKIKETRPATKILVLTENDQQGQAAREAGADYFLLKGFPATELVHLVETSLIQDSREEIDLSTKE
ncbi:response regulator transcription factor [Chloroflexota bacterium]